MLFVIIIIYIIGFWFFWVGSHNNSKIPDEHKFALPILWPLYVTRAIIYYFFKALFIFFK